MAICLVPQKLKKERELRPFKQLNLNLRTHFHHAIRWDFTVTFNRLSLKFFGKAAKILKYFFQPKNT